MGEQQRFNFRGLKQHRDRPDIIYDKEKVKELKEKITKSLKYSSNIHGLEPDEHIIAAVKGVSYQGGETFREIHLFSHRFGAVSKERQKEKESNLPTGMTMRVKKRDVDSFAKGELDYEQFCKTVETFAY